MLWFWNLPPHLSTPSQRPSPTKAEFSVVEKGSQRWPDGGNPNHCPWPDFLGRSPVSEC